MGEFDGRVALITGSGSGMGRATALEVASRGATVVVSDVKVDEGEKTVELVEAQGGKAAFLRADVTDEGEISALIDEIVSRFGRLDFAHNNAGVTDTPCNTVDMSLERWKHTVEVDLTGVFICVKHELRVMLEAGRGSIVNTSSGAGINGVGGLPAYVAAKHGVIGLTKTAAIECGPTGVRINAVCPGVIATPMIVEHLSGDEQALAAMVAAQPAGRIGEPAEVASAVAYLFTDGAAFITGAALPVDGGAVAD